MNAKTIVIDIDDTLGDLKTRLQNIYREKTGRKDIHYRDWTDFSAVNYGYSFDDLTDFFIEDNSLKLMRPHMGIIETTKRFRELGYEIEIVTARAWHPKAQEVTTAWLAENQVTYDRLNIVGLGQCKEEATRHIQEITLFIDDRVEHCEAMYKSGRVGMTLLYAQPWNKTQYETLNYPDDKFYRLEDIRESLRFL